jgi:hypothetical protein
MIIRDMNKKRLRLSTQRLTEMEGTKFFVFLTELRLSEGARLHANKRSPRVGNVYSRNGDRCVQLGVRHEPGSYTGYVRVRITQDVDGGHVGCHFFSLSTFKKIRKAVEKAVPRAN